MQNSKPLVSIGMAVYNEVKYIRQALDSLLAQSFKDFELVISDNASTDGTWSILQDYAVQDPRIFLHRQSENRGAAANFQFVLDQARGEYFMWAAGDDEWESIFVECCLNELLLQGDDFVAVMMEAQYFSDRGFYDFFPEGVPFYNSNIINLYERMSHMIDYNYGNLYYSLFKRDALFENSVSFFSLLNQISLNEIPLFLFVLIKGQWRVLPQIGLYKRTNDFTYAQAKWEKQGGRLPNSKGIRYYNRLPTILRYHRSALKDICNTIDLLNVEQTTKKSLKLKVRNNILKHGTYFITRMKPKLF